MKFAFLNLENELIKQYPLNPKSNVEPIKPLVSLESLPILQTYNFS